MQNNGYWYFADTFTEGNPTRVWLMEDGQAQLLVVFDVTHDGKLTHNVEVFKRPVHFEPLPGLGK
jgi:hypothetical protein